MKHLATNLLVLALATIAALALAEITTRVLYPVSVGNDRIGPDGARLSDWVVPGTVYRQVSSEYDALTTITDKGYRVPSPRGNPDVIFIGDSFTFGWGLSDDETFAAIYCKRLGLSCANLGLPSTGTAQQLDRLEEYLDVWEWQPREVKLFIMAMTASFSAGNDLADNYDYVRWSRHIPGLSLRDSARAIEDTLAGTDGRLERKGVSPGFAERVLGFRNSVLRFSNLARVVKYLWGPMLRSKLAPTLDQQRLSEALALTKAELDRLDQMSRRYNFKYSIYLLHPAQDIIRDKDGETFRMLDSVSPIPITPTAQLFERNPRKFYYPYDGHLNSAGSARVAELLIREALAGKREDSR